MPINSRWTIPLEVCSVQTHIFETHYLSYQDYRLWSQRLAAGLQKAGLQPGDRVLLFSGNTLFYPTIFMGVLMAGGIFTGANPGYMARELAYQLKDSGAKFLICADESLKLGIEASASIGMSKSQVFLLDDLLLEGTGQSRLGVRNLKELMEPKHVGENFRWFEPQDAKDTTCCLNYSSGTTGVPKGVMITHFNYVSNTMQFGHLATLNPNEPELTRNSWLCYLPMYHAMAQTLFVAGGPKRQIPIYIMKKFDFVKVLEYVQKYRITSLAMVPPVVILLAKSPLTKNYDLSSVVDVGSGSAPLGGEVLQEFEALWPERDRKLKQGWGMTEATCSLLGWDPRLESNPSSVGELNANCSAKIMNMDGTAEVPKGQRGEIWVKAPNIMKGYWKNEKATKEIFVDGPDGRWMRTGDIAYVDDQGRFFIVDRIKELIKVKANQVAPAELEALLLEHSQIADACVVGVTINGGEVPRAYIVPKAGEKPSAKQVADWLGEKVSRHKKLVGGVVFVDSIPKTPSGKMLRKLLRERAKEEVGDKEPAQAKL